MFMKEFPAHKKPMPMHHVPLTWVLVADGRQAQIFTRHINPIDEELELQPVFPMPLKAKPVERETGRKIQPRIFQSVGKMRHALEPSVNIEHETVKRFMDEIAEKLGKAWEGKFFERLILIAPAPVIGELRKALPKEVWETVTLEIHKRLTHCDPKALSLYLTGLI